jgi:hypothetical protein
MRGTGANGSAATKAGDQHSADAGRVTSAQPHPMISATAGTRVKDLRSPVDGFCMLKILT